MEQGSDEWYEIKKLHFSASNANAIMANGAGLKTLVDEMLCEYYSSGKFPEYSGKFKNPHMQRGNDFEDKAAKIYELETGRKVEKIGFIELDEHIGCSPDRLVGEDGLLEIKNPSDQVFMKLKETKKIDKKYLDQMQMQMFVSGRSWCDFFAFNPNFTPCFELIRVTKDIEAFKLITQGLSAGKALLKQKKEALDKLFDVV